jgi:integrase
VLPTLGSVQLRHIDAGRLNALYAHLLADGKKSNGGGGLSPRSVSYLHTIVHRALKDRKHRQQQLKERLLMGAGFTDYDLVFCRPDGGPLHPERFARTFQIEAVRAGLPKIRLHDLRHTWATLALAAGEHPKVVQERLGHANVSITLDIYSRVTEGLHGAAADRVAGLIFGTN